MKTIFFLLLLALAQPALFGQALPVRDQAAVINSIVSERIDSLLPALMDRYKVDMWIIVSREYNEDPLLKTLLPAEWLSARRRTIFVFCLDPSSKKYEKLAIARYTVGSSITPAWDVSRVPDQWEALNEVVRAHHPAVIALNTSASFAHADGIDYTDYHTFLEKLPVEYRGHIASAEKLAVAWMETRTSREMAIYPSLIEATHRIIEEGFSEKVNTAGITTTEDLVWWFRQKIRDLGYDTWFHPSVSIQRADTAVFDHNQSFSSHHPDLILPGDLLHVDFGITYLRLNTDVQEHAYLLKPGEFSVPAGLAHGFAVANRLQDILTGQFAAGQTGNQVLSAALAQAKKEGIAATIYTHPIGFNGHAAGPTIGLWDQQNGVPGSGDFPMHYRTAYSIELNAAVAIPEWKKTVRMMLEEDGYFDENGFRYISGRQKEIFTVPRQHNNIGN